MKKLFFLFGVAILSLTLFANPPAGSCSTAGNEPCNGYCVSIYDASGNVTYGCFPPENMTPDCMR